MNIFFAASETSWLVSVMRLKFHMRILLRIVRNRLQLHRHIDCGGGLIVLTIRIAFTY